MANFASKLGIGFFSRDEGAKEDLTRLGDLVENLGSKLDSIKQTNALNSMINAVSLGKLDGIGDKFEDITNAASENKNLSGDLASQYAQFSKEASKVSAQLGESEEKIKQNTSFWRSLNMDQGEVIQNYHAMRSMDIKPEDLGFDSLKGVMKMTETLGVDTKDLFSSMKQLKGVDFSKSQMKESIAGVVEVGQQFGSAKAFMNNFGEVASGLQEKMSSLSVTMDPERFKAFQEQTFGVAAALKEMTGATPEEAVSQAQSMSEEMLSMRQQLEGMEAGRDDLPEPIKALLETEQFSSVEQIRGLMKEGPVSFMQKLNKVGGDARKRFVTSDFFGGIGSSMQNLIKNAPPEKLEKIFNKTSKGLESVEGSKADEKLKSVSDKYETGLTKQEQYNRIQENFNQRIHNIANSTGVANKVLSQSRSTYQRLGDTVSELSGIYDENVGQVSALGIKLKTAEGEVTALGDAAKSATDVWLGYKKAGLQGAAIQIGNVISQHEELAGLLGDSEEEVEKNKQRMAALAGTLGEMAPQMLETAAAMNLMGVELGSFSALLGPAGILAGVVGGLYLLETKWEDGLKGFVEDAKSKVREVVPNLYFNLMETMGLMGEGKKKAYLNLTNSFEAFKSHLSSEGLPLLKESIKDLGNKAWDLIKTAFIPVANASSFIFDEISGFIDSINWKSLGQKAAEYIESMGGVIWEAFFGDSGDTDSAAEDAASKLAGSIISLSGQVIKGLGEAIWGLVSRSMANTVKTFTDDNATWGEAFKQAGTNIGGWIAAGIGASLLGGPILGSIGKAMLWGPKQLAKLGAKSGSKIASGIWSGIKGSSKGASAAKAMGVGGKAGQATSFAAKGGQATGLMSKLGKFAPKMGKFSSVLRTAFGWAAKLLGPLISVGNIIKQVWDISSAIANQDLSPEEMGWTVFKNTLDMINFALLGIPGYVGEAMGISKGHVKAFYYWVNNITGDTISYIKQGWSGFKTDLANIMDFLTVKSQNAFSNIAEGAIQAVSWIMKKFGGIQKSITGIVTSISTRMEFVLSDIKNFALGIWDIIKGMFNDYLDYIITDVFGGLVSMAKKLGAGDLVPKGVKSFIEKRQQKEEDREKGPSKAEQRRQKQKAELTKKLKGFISKGHVTQVELKNAQRGGVEALRSLLKQAKVEQATAGTNKYKQAAKMMQNQADKYQRAQDKRNKELAQRIQERSKKQQKTERRLEAGRKIKEKEMQKKTREVFKEKEVKETKDTTTPDTGEREMEGAGSVKDSVIESETSTAKVNKQGFNSLRQEVNNMPKQFVQLLVRHSDKIQKAFGGGGVGEIDFNDQGRGATG